MEKPDIWARKLADMEMPNYDDFSILTNALAKLLAAEIPVLYITGDVHWGHIVEGASPRGKNVFYEVIASPSRLIDTAGSDQINSLKNIFRANPKPFPLHPDAPADLAGIKLANLKYKLCIASRAIMLRFCVSMQFRAELSSVWITSVPTRMKKAAPLFIDARAIQTA